MSDRSIDEKQLWHLLTRGDTQALEVVYNRYFSLLFNYGLRLCNDEELVKDVIHDLFLKVFDNPNLRQDISIASYLLTSLKNNLVERMYALHQMIELDETDLFRLGKTDDVIEVLHEADDESLRKHRNVKKAFDQLTQNQQQVLYLRYVHEMKYEEIARFLHINKQSAMNLATRAMMKLRTLLTNNRI